MVVGPASSGKTSVVKALTNLALGTGMGWTPGVIGLDPASVSFCPVEVHSLKLLGTDLIAAQPHTGQPVYVNAPIPSSHPSPRQSSRLTPNLRPFTYHGIGRADCRLVVRTS